MNEWQRCPDTTVTSGVLARPLPWGVLITHGGSDNPDAPYPTAPQWDLSIPELEWLLELAKETPDA